MVRRLLLALAHVTLVAAGLVVVPSAAHASDYSAPLPQAIADLPTAT